LTDLPRELDRARREIEGYARQYGLDFYDVVFEVLDYDQLNEVAAFGGFPTRYPHWRFGMEYEELSKSYSYGLSKIYELVINNNPVYAYLMKANAPVEQKLVMAHVFGHADFFKNNLWFSKTNRRMVDAMANHATRVRHHIDRHGIEAVENFIDACLSLENLIDYHAPFVERRREPRRPLEREEEDAPRAPVRLPSKSYMEPYINPPSYLEQQKTKHAERAKRKRQVPSEPERDVLKFLLDHAPLESWEHDVLSIVREEAYYFAPQAMTKTLNEGWACLSPESLVYSDLGVVSMKQLVEGPAAKVSDGNVSRRVYDTHVKRDHATVTIRTRRGFTLCGSSNHRVLASDGRTFVRLDALHIGARLALSGGVELWPEGELALEWRPAERVTLDEVAEWAGVSRTRVEGWRRGVGLKTMANPAAIDVAFEVYDSPENQVIPVQRRKRKKMWLPDRVDEDLAAFLGYLVGDGHISRAKHHFALTTGDEPQARDFARLAGRLFGLLARMKWDDGRWRVLLHSETASDFLVEALGLTHGPSARHKRIPDVIMRSPRNVVTAFLRAYFDCDAYAGDHGFILSTTSDVLADQVQILLLNYGILTTRGRQAHDCWHVRVGGRSAKVLAEKIGFGLARKQRALERYVTDRRWFCRESWEDEVVSIEHGRADVYDISVEETHRYAAQGFINHNSYWHSTILTQKALNASELIDYADQHSGTLAMTPGRMNPYKIGIELFREIEDRWNKGKFGKEYEECDDIEERRRWDRKLGLGRQKIFEVRKIYNDVMFIDAFMDQEFCDRLQLYVYGYDTRSGRYVVVDRDWRKVKERFLFSLTNLGQPIIHVQDANYGNRGELYLVHKFEGIPLDLDKARDTLKNLHRLWRRPVHLETVEDERGRLLSFDGAEHKNVRL
jgi:stage V sporulation protein R